MVKEKAIIGQSGGPTAVIYKSLAGFIISSLDNFEEVISPQTAYQITSILEGVIKRGTGKGLRDLILDLAGKTGTTNKNTEKQNSYLYISV